MVRKPQIASIVDEYVASHDVMTVAGLATAAGITRQAAQRRLATLVRAGRLQIEGHGKATRYRRSPLPPPPSPDEAPALYHRRLSLPVDEDLIWREVERALPALHLPAARNAAAIAAYAFTEMMNNAVDHSASAAVEVRAGVTAGDLWFDIADAGMGAFENVRARFGLSDHLAALQELSKGKVTTQPDRHTGEGLFFTSKMADAFELEANGLRWLVDNRRADQGVGSAQAAPGTRVRFQVALDKQERPEQVFARYTHDFEFDTTRTVVKLFEYGVRFVSRSEARRLLAGLERFRHVLIDFRGVEAVGQGFADEVFRVWPRQHPSVEVTPENMNDPVRFMVERARRQAR
jgi:hypothetical protein